MSAKIIAAFPACGKTTYYNTYSVYNNTEDNSEVIKQKVIDLDSTNELFQWKLDESTNMTYISHPDFPNNFIQFIKNHIETEDIIFVSTYWQVLDALKDAGIHYYLVHPKRDLKNEWIDRFAGRGNSKGFIDMIDRTWDTSMDKFESDDFPTKIEIGSGMIMTKELIDDIK